MKKIVSVILIFLILLGNLVHVNASVALYTNDPINGNTDWIFEGDIKPKYNFFDGDIPTNNDFTVNGTLKNLKGEEPDLPNVKVVNVTDIYKENNSYYVIIRLSCTSANLKDEDNGHVGFLVKTNVNVIPFNKKVKQNIKNGQIIKLTNTKKLPNIKLTSSTGRPIDGEVQYSSRYNDLISGYNDITWSVIPGNKKFGTIKGNFTIYKNPTFKLQLYSYAVTILGLDSSYHQVKVNNGAWKTLSVPYVNGLKANTKYKIQIRQKASKTRKATVLKVYNIKTPKS